MLMLPFNEQLRRITVSGPIREEASALFVEQITALEVVDVGKPISVYIDTSGGSVDSALCMSDRMKACACPIIIVGVGKVMSAGVLLLAAGEHGYRFITENTRVMIHEISSGVMGSVSEMESSVKEARRMQEVYLEILSKESGVNRDRLLKDMKAETYMSAAEAVKYGIADKLVPTRKITKKLKLVKEPVNRAKKTIKKK